LRIEELRIETLWCAQSAQTGLIDHETPEGVSRVVPS
jgi:hypothetical protein